MTRSNREVLKEIHYAGGMSRERFCQEAILISLPLLVKDAVNVLGPIDEETAERIAREAVLIGYAVDEAFGPDSLPHDEEDV